MNFERKNDPKFNKNQDSSKMMDDEIMKDLLEKYDLGQPENHNDQNSLKMMDEEIMNDMKREYDQFSQELKTLPFKQETFSQKELNQIIEIRSHLGQYINDFNQEVKHLKPGSPEYIRICNEHINKVVHYLDQLPIWAYKFSTECGGKSSGSLEFTPDDSYYYVTPSNISLRLRRVGRDEGLRTVIQAFMEKIVFRFRTDNQIKILIKPEIGFKVIEHRSKEFKNILEQSKVNQDYTSPIKTYFKDDEIFFVEATDEEPHEGDRVNQIFSLINK